MTWLIECSAFLDRRRLLVFETLNSCVPAGECVFCHLICPKQGTKIEGVILHRVGILGLFCAKQGQGFKSSAAPLYPNVGQVPLGLGGDCLTERSTCCVT